jgi:(1->4)-alpha-D-glucan 1-alpha-D-glucosylmutase
VDYDARRRSLDDLQKASQRRDDGVCDLARQLSADIHDPRVKLFVICKALGLRKQASELFLEGNYVPLPIAGVKAKHVLAYSRSHDGQSLLVAVPRLSARLLGEEMQLPVGERVWGDTRLHLPETSVQQWRNMLTGELIPAEKTNFLRVSDVLNSFPVALLTNV